MTGEDWRQGVVLMPGVYDHDGELHVDADEFIRAVGGDPASEVDQAGARRIIARLCAGLGIECVEVD